MYMYIKTLHVVVNLIQYQNVTSDHSSFINKILYNFNINSSFTILVLNQENNCTFCEVQTRDLVKNKSHPQISSKIRILYFSEYGINAHQESIGMKFICCNVLIDT